jgi:protein-S-isoprenylcysteine O-methyltransferase Ste14
MGRVDDIIGDAFEGWRCVDRFVQRWPWWSYVALVVIVVVAAGAATGHSAETIAGNVLFLVALYGLFSAVRRLGRRGHSQRAANLASEHPENRP